MELFIIWILSFFLCIFSAVLADRVSKEWDWVFGGIALLGGLIWIVFTLVAMFCFCQTNPFGPK